MAITKRKIETQKSQISKTISIRFHSSVLQSIRQHARSSLNMEICGVLIGKTSAGVTLVEGAVAGEGAAQGGAHVTFTQEAWVKIHKEKNERFPDRSIVGWYHSHPGFGVFLSEHDLFIHNNFFAEPGHIAWVYDPHSDEEGCYGWGKGKVCRLNKFEVINDTTKRSMPEEIIEAVMTKKQTLTVRRVAPRQFFKQHLTLILTVIGIIIFIIVVFLFIPRPKAHTIINTEGSKLKSGEVTPETPQKGTGADNTKKNE